MKKFFILLLLLFVAITDYYSQTGDTINRIDGEKRRQGHWVITNKLMPEPLEDYLPNQKVEDGRYLNNNKTGIWVGYFKTGSVKHNITFDQGTPRGKAIIYHANGKVAEQGDWQDGRWVGEYKLFHENGKPQHEFKYNANGKREGVQKYYAENGQLIMAGEMSNGKEAGTWTRWDENGIKIAEENYTNGTLTSRELEKTAKPNPLIIKKEIEKPVPEEATHVDPTKAIPFDGNGYAKLFRSDRQLGKDGYFKNFKLIDGKEFIYSKDGILQRISVFKGGKYEGDAPIPKD